MNDDVHSLSGAYALDALDPAERDRFRRHLASCATCRQEVDDLAEVSALLGSAAAEAPPEAMRAATLAAVDQVRPLPPHAGRARSAGAASDVGGGTARGRRSRLVARGVLAAAAAVLVAVAAVVAFGPWGAQDDPTAASVLGADDAREVVERLDGFSATLVVSEGEDGAVIVSDDMPPAPDGHAYQLWFERPGEGMVAAGLMPPSDAGQEVLLEGRLGDATAVGVTVEPEGGSTAPTTDPVVVFALT